jgi:hypothetical protein
VHGERHGEENRIYMGGVEAGMIRVFQAEQIGSIDGGSSKKRVGETGNHTKIMEIILIPL